MTTKFTWNKIEFEVKQNANGEWLYRDAAHIGGPWSLAKKTLDCKSYHAGFRKALQKAIAG